MGRQKDLQRQRELLEAYQRIGTIAGVAREFGIARQTVQHHIGPLIKNTKPHVAGSVHGTRTAPRPIPKQGVSRYILTCAQNNTQIHMPTWRNLMALAEHYNAEVHVSRFTYNKNAYRGIVKPGTEKGDAELWYAPEIDPYKSDDRVRLAPTLTWCGEMNISPTAKRPLSGFKTYTGESSGIFPHAKQHLGSVSNARTERSKQIMTTGTVTMRNYLQRSAGLKAEHHHVYGGLLVEVDSDGRWFVRQLNADNRGTIYDLELKAEGGKVEVGYWCEAINWGDVHVGVTDPTVRNLAWAEGGMIDVLRPKFQFSHDTVDFHARNKYAVKNPHLMYERYIAGVDNVRVEMERVVEHLHWSSRPWCQTIVVDSNHDNGIEHWLRTSDYRDDPVNAEYFLELQSAKYAAIKREAGASIPPSQRHHVVEDALRRVGCPESVRFLRPDDPFLICRGRISCENHGHTGPNGGRGSPEQFAQMAHRMNVGHFHYPAIIDGLFVAGTSSLLDLEYTRGPSSWSHSHIVTYRNGKRAIVTIFDGKWRA